MSLLHFCEWLGQTPGSIALHESLYVFLVVLTVHVLTLCLFVGSAIFIDLRLLGLTLRRVPVTDLMRRLLPWNGAGFVLMVISGSLLFYADPVSRYFNVFFRLKMAALALALVNAVFFQRTIYRRVGDWDLAPVPPRAARVAAAVSLLLLGTVITLGRLIPYQRYWFPN